MEKILIVVYNDFIDIYGSLFDFINYNTENINISSTDIIMLNNTLNNINDFIEIEIEFKNGKKEIIKLKYIDVISNWESIGKKFNNRILKKEL